MTMMMMRSLSLLLSFRSLPITLMPRRTSCPRARARETTCRRARLCQKNIRENACVVLRFILLHAGEKFFDFVRSNKFSSAAWSRPIDKRTVDRRGKIRTRRKMCEKKTPQSCNVCTTGWERERMYYARAPDGCAADGCAPDGCAPDGCAPDGCAPGRLRPGQWSPCKTAF